MNRPKDLTFSEGLCRLTTYAFGSNESRGFLRREESTVLAPDAED